MAGTLTSRRIVVRVDGSVASAAAVRWAVHEARLRAATVHLVCAYHHDPRMRAPYAVGAEAPSPDEGYAAQAMLAAAEDLARRDLPPDQLTAEIAAELPVRALLERAAGAELLVLGTTRSAGGPGQPPPAVDPVARDCVRLAACPVVVVASGDEPAGGAPARQPAAGVPAGVAG